METSKAAYVESIENFCFLDDTNRDLVDAKPLGDAFRMINMLAQQFYLLVPSFVPPLANYTSVSQTMLT